jgi:hypothetical protein
MDQSVYGVEISRPLATKRKSTDVSQKLTKQENGPAKKVKVEEHSCAICFETFPVEQLFQPRHHCGGYSCIEVCFRNLTLNFFYFCS